MENITAKLSNIPHYLPRMIIFILALGVLVQLGLSIKTLMAPLPVSKAVKVAPIREGTLLLLSQKDQYKVGETIPVLVRVDSGGHSVDGVDAVIRYDNKLLLASSSAIIRGTAFSDFPQAVVDQKNGLIKISGVSGVSGTAFSGIDELATVNFKAVAPGTAAAVLDFTKAGDTSDSNIIEAGTPDDVLGKVVNLKVNIK